MSIDEQTSIPQPSEQTPPTGDQPVPSSEAPDKTDTRLAKLASEQQKLFAAHESLEQRKDDLRREFLNDLRTKAESDPNEAFKEIGVDLVSTLDKIFSNTDPDPQEGSLPPNVQDFQKYVDQRLQEQRDQIAKEIEERSRTQTVQQKMVDGLRHIASDPEFEVVLPAIDAGLVDPHTILNEINQAYEASKKQAKIFGEEPQLPDFKKIVGNYEQQLRDNLTNFTKSIANFPFLREALQEALGAPSPQEPSPPNTGSSFGSSSARVPEDPARARDEILGMIKNINWSDREK